NIFGFYQPFALNQTNPNLMLVGSSNGAIYTADFSTAQKVGNTLNVALGVNFITGGDFPAGTLEAGGAITALAYADVAYVGTDQTNRALGGKVSQGALLIRAAGADQFAKATGYAGSTPLAITVDPRDPNRAYILDAEGRVWVTLNGGATTPSFTQIGGAGANVTANLPALPANSTLTFGAITIIPTGATAGSGEDVLVSNPPGTTGGGVFITQIPNGTAPDF